MTAPFGKMLTHVFVFDEASNLLKHTEITVEQPMNISRQFFSHYGRVRVQGKRYTFRAVPSLHLKSEEIYIPLKLSGGSLELHINQKVIDTVSNVLLQ